MNLFKLFGTIAIDNADANKSIDETTGKAEHSEPKIVSAFKKIGAAVATYFAVEKIVAFGNEVVNLTASFEDAMLKVQSLSGATQEEYKQLSDAALEYGSKTAWTAKDVADAMGYMALAGFNTNQILDSTSGMLSLASAAGENLATVTDILTDSMTGFGDEANQASRYADVLATVQAKSNTTVGLLGDAFKYVSPLAGAYKYSLEDTAAALGVMANAGVKGSMAGTSLSAIITRLGNDTNGARKAIESMGVSFFNQDGSARNLSAVLTDLCKVTKNMTAAEKAAFASTVAGQEAQKGLLAILNQGSEAYEGLREQLGTCEGAASAMAENMESGIGGAIRNIQSALEGFKIALGQKFSEPLGNVIRKAAEWINGTLTPSLDTASATFHRVMTPVMEKLNAVSAWIANSNIQEKLALLGEALLFVWETIGQPIFEALMSAFQTVYDEFMLRWPEISAFVQQCFEDIIQFWNQNLKPCLEAIGAFIKNVLAPVFNAVFNGYIAPTIETAFKFIKSLWENTLKPVFVGITDFLTGVFTANWEQAWNGIKSILTGILNGIISGVERMVNNAINAINALIEGINEVADLAGDKLGFDFNIPTLPQVFLPRLAKGGVLEKGQVGLLEGSGAEAVVPLERNRAWISAVARDMDAEFTGGNQTVAELKEAFIAFVDELPEMMADAFAAMKFDVNNREFARLVKAVN